MFDSENRVVPMVRVLYKTRFNTDPCHAKVRLDDFVHTLLHAGGDFEFLILEKVDDDD